MLVWWAFHSRQLLDVVGDDHRGHLALGDGHAEGAVDDMAQLRRMHHRLHVGGDVLEQGMQVDFLLVVAAKRRGGLLAHQGNHRHMVHLGIVQAVEQVDGAGA